MCFVAPESHHCTQSALNEFTRSKQPLFRHTFIPRALHANPNDPWNEWTRKFPIKAARLERSQADFLLPFFSRRYRGNNALDKLASLPTRLNSSSSSQIYANSTSWLTGASQIWPTEAKHATSQTFKRRATAFGELVPSPPLNQRPTVNYMQRGREGGVWGLSTNQGARVNGGHLFLWGCSTQRKTWIFPAIIWIPKSCVSHIDFALFHFFAFFATQTVSIRK